MWTRPILGRSLYTISSVLPVGRLMCHSNAADQPYWWLPSLGNGPNTHGFVYGTDISGSGQRYMGDLTCSRVVHARPLSRLPPALSVRISRRPSAATDRQHRAGRSTTNPEEQLVKLQRYSALAGLTLTATLALTACGSDNPTPTNTGSGGSSATAITAATGPPTPPGTPRP